MLRSCAGLSLLSAINDMVLRGGVRHPEAGGLRPPPACPAPAQPQRPLCPCNPFLLGDGQEVAGVGSGGGGHLPATPHPAGQVGSQL